jgi:phenylacetic acid degradation protein paaN
MSLFEKHSALLHRAAQAVKERTYYAAFPENPKEYGDEAAANGEKNFKEMLHKSFQLWQKTSAREACEEVSPYTLEKTGVRYPIYDADEISGKANLAFAEWSQLSLESRMGILLESLERIKNRFFEIAWATMHTTGQSFIMSFQASGPHAADRALETLALAYEELTRFPSETEWQKPMGKITIQLKKTFYAIPRGVGLVIGCSTFPVWNSLPSVFANLAAGNSVIVKPHAGAVLPIAICVKEIQQVMKEAGLVNPAIVLAADTIAAPVTKQLAGHENIQLIDYTGNTSFGDYLERIEGKTVFTEKAGVNCAILDSVTEIDPVIQNLAFSVSLYSGQMCTAPQNILIPSSGIKANDRHYTYDEVLEKLKGGINAIASNPKMGVGVLGAIQNENTWNRVEQLPAAGARIIQKGSTISSEQFSNVRSHSPAILETVSSAEKIFGDELFGPVIVVVKTNDISESIAIASRLAKQKGAITCAAWSTDENVITEIEKSMLKVFTPVTINLTGPIWVNQHAAFSDFHVTGGNRAGNASLTNPEFVTRRFVWVGNRRLI